MTPAIVPDASRRRAIARISKADINMCWTCKACLAECPVNIATDRLQPLRIVRMAALGMLDELVRLPEIWYCLTCRRCNEVCPMSVKPFLLIDYLRREALERGIVTYQMIQGLEEAIRRLHRARWFAACDCRSGYISPSQTMTYWEKAGQSNVPVFNGKIQMGGGHPASRPESKEMQNINLCLTCGECCSICPVCYDGDVFNPMKILRMAVLGLTDELMKSPAIWLCFGCRRCGEVCSQDIATHIIISDLREETQKRYIVDDDYPYRLMQMSKSICKQFIEDVDSIFQRTEPLFEKAAAIREALATAPL